MNTETKRIKTGIPALDDALRGGLPANRTVLLSGGPGTGKSTVAMQFLQSGLRRNECCLYVSTEQTPAEIRDSFAPYAFDLADENLSVATIHATPGYILESEKEVLTLDTLSDATETDGGNTEYSFDAFNAPFTAQYVAEFLDQYKPCDRVVFDSISGLAATATDEHVFRRSVLDLIRLFTDEYGATTVFTAEQSESASAPALGAAELLRFNTHGVIELWREQIEGDYHRFLQVMKMRGIDHATQSFEMEFSHDGVHVLPHQRTPSTAYTSHEKIGTGVSGLDRLCGGGFIKGGTALLEHDGRAYVEVLVTNAITEAVRNDEAIVLLPPSNLSPQRLEQMIGERVGSVEELLANDQMFVLDLVGNWSGYGPNVFGIHEYEQRVRWLFGGLKPLVAWKMQRIFRQMNARRGDRTVLAVVFTEAMLQEFDPEEVRQMYYWAKKTLFVPEDTVVFVQNPAVMEETLSEFFVYDAQQMLRTWVHESGLQYVKLEKSPTGHLGTTRLVEHVDYPPYVRVQRPGVGDTRHKS